MCIKPTYYTHICVLNPLIRLYSNATAEVMDEEVRSIVAEAYTRTLALMEERREQVRLVAELLLEKEVGHMAYDICV
jgi:ATP-dependent Zn protease